MHPKTLLSYAFLFFGYYFILGARDSRRRLFRALGIFSDEDLKTLSKEALQKRDSYSVWDKHFNRDEVPKEQFAVGLFLEYLEDRRLNLNRGRARALSHLLFRRREREKKDEREEREERGGEKKKR